MGLTSDQLKALVDYLEANAIEYFLKKGQTRNWNKICHAVFRFFAH